MKDISIVIPFHNEEESLRILIPELINQVRLINESIEILFIDDCSDDNSANVVRESISGQSNVIKLLSLEKRSGQTGAYKYSFSVAEGKYILRMDADLQDSPQDLPYFIEKKNQGYDLIMGLREARKHSRLLRFASSMYDILILLLFNSPLHSNSGSYVMFRADLVQNIRWKKNDHRYLPLIAMNRGAGKIGEVLVRHNDRQYGSSKYKPVKKIIFGIPEVFRFFLRLRRGYYRK